MSDGGGIDDNDRSSVAACAHNVRMGEESVAMFPRRPR